MKPNKPSSVKLNIPGIVILACLLLCTFVLGVYGFSNVYVLKPNVAHAEFVRWFDVLYSTIKLFSLISSPADEAINHWAVSAARLGAVCSVFFTIAFATFFTAGSWIKSNILIKYYKEHYLVFGLNHESIFLINDLLEQQKKVVVIDSDHTNPLLAELKNKNVAILIGDASNISLQLKAGVLTAKAMVAMTGCDLTNLAILKALMESSYQPALRCHIGIDNVMSYKLFEPSAYYSVTNIKKSSPGLLINIFNLDELVAIDLVQKIDLGGNADTISTKANGVSVLLVGSNDISVAILRELLLLSHFCNHKKIKIDVLTSGLNDFFITYHQVLEHCNGKGLDLWDIAFITDKSKITSPSDYNHIIACDNNENIALKDILRFYDLCTLSQMRSEDTSTSFHYYNALNHDIEHQQIKSFGALKKIANYSQLLNNTNETLAKKSHEDYVKSELSLQNVSSADISEKLAQHDQEITNSAKWLHWLNQPLFKRRSNYTEKRHIPMKLLALGGSVPSSVFDNSSPSFEGDLSFLPFLNEFDDLDRPMIRRWLFSINKTTGLSSEELTERMHALARTEHDRWNAFHIVNNWRYGEVKDESIKTHDCLLSWEDLEIKRPETIKYDYRNIYHIAESVALLNNNG